MRLLWITAIVVLLALMLAWADQVQANRAVRVFLWTLSVVAAFAVGFTN